MVEGDVLQFTKRVKDLITNVANTSRIKYLDFLNISEQEILASMVKKSNEVNVTFGGGFTGSERKRAVLVPSHIPIDAVDPKIKLLKIDVIDTGELTHSQVLGSLMSLNIDRSIIGDITAHHKGAMFAACGEFYPFLVENFTKVGRHHISLKLIEEEVVRDVQQEEMEVIISSMRLDVIVKALMNVSRNKAEAYLEAGNVRHNHTVEKKVSKTCNIGDVLSIRKYGRFCLTENKKTTKSGKIVLVVSKSV